MHCDNSKNLMLLLKKNRKQRKKTGTFTPKITYSMSTKQKVYVSIGLEALRIPLVPYNQHSLAVSHKNRFYLAVYNLNGITLNGAGVVML